MTEPEAYQRMRSLDETERTSYAEKGHICLTVRSNMLHQKRINPETGEPCSLTEWIRCAAPWGYSTCFAAMRACEQLSDVPAKDLAQIPEGNIHILTQLSTAVRNSPAVLQAAQTKRYDDFAEHIERHHPDQHITRPTTLRYVADKTQAAEINQAIDRFIQENGIMSRTQALAGISIEYMASVTFDEIVKDLKQ